MEDEGFERFRPSEAQKGSKKSYVFKSWNPNALVGLFLAFLLLAPNLSRSAQLTVRIAQANNTPAFCFCLCS